MVAAVVAVDEPMPALPWEHVENPLTLNEYVEGEVEKFLGEGK